MSRLMGAISSLAMALGPQFVRDARLDGLRVTLFGLRSHISRDTIRYLNLQGATVTASGLPHEVERLWRDLELVHVTVNLAPIDTINAAEIGLITDNLRALGELPQVIVSCCTGGDCSASVAVPVMQPPLALHLAANGSARGAPAFAAKTLAALLGDAGLFDPARALSKVRLGRGLFDVSRRDAAPGGGPQNHQPDTDDRIVRLSISARGPSAPIGKAIRSQQGQSRRQG